MLFKCALYRARKMYECASNACVFFLLIVFVKFVTKSTLFCCQSELRCNFMFFAVIHMALKKSKLATLILKRGNILICDIFVASIVVWRSYFAHSCCPIHVTLFYRKLTYVVIYALVFGKIVFA